MSRLPKPIRNTYHAWDKDRAWMATVHLLHVVEAFVWFVTLGCYSWELAWWFQFEVGRKEKRDGK